jgi:hypothetical protein
MTPRSRRRPLLPISLLALLAALALPAAAGAVELQIVNASTHHDDEVWVAVHGEPSPYDVTNNETPAVAVPDNTPKLLSELPGGILEINEIESGRVYISYGTPTTEPPDFESKTSRFGWIELNEKPGDDSDKVNLTAVDQFGIGMRLDTYATVAAGGEHLEELGSANSDTIFAALQRIPGGEGATIRNSSNEIVRVLSPTHTTAYPDLGEYVRSMAGREITVHSTFSAEEKFASSRYSGSFEADGSITLRGSFHGPALPKFEAPTEIHLPGNQLIEDVYTGGGTENDLEGEIRHDVLVGFMAGYWGGAYGDDALGFCTNPEEHRSGYEAFPYCPTGFNKPAFGDARPALSPFPTCEQYAATIGEYAEMYGNPYSDGAAGNVAINVNKSDSGKTVGSLKLTILPDSGDAQPTTAGNSNCGAAAPAPPPSPASASTTSPGGQQEVGKQSTGAVGARFFKRAHVRRGKAKVGVLRCPGGCTRVRLIARQGRKLLGVAKLKRAGKRRALVLRLTKLGRKALARRSRTKVRLTLLAKPAGGPTQKLNHSVLLVRGTAKRGRRR